MPAVELETFRISYAPHRSSFHGRLYSSRSFSFELHSYLVICSDQPRYCMSFNRQIQQSHSYIPIVETRTQFKNTKRFPCLPNNPLPSVISCARRLQLLLAVYTVCVLLFQWILIYSIIDVKHILFSFFSHLSKHSLTSVETGNNPHFPDDFVAQVN